VRRAGLAATRQGRPLRQPGAYANDGPLVPDIADVRAPALEDGRQFSTQVAGLFLFLFLPLVLDLDLPQAVSQAALPGSEQIPPLQALLALLAPKLLGKRRGSHISDLCWAADGAIHPLAERTGPSALWYLENVDGALCPWKMWMAPYVTSRNW